MTTIRKFFDKGNKEVSPDKAVKAVELTFGDKGEVISSKTFTVGVLTDD